MKKVALAVGLVLAAFGLAGCEKPVEEMGYAEMQSLAKDIEQRCTDLGLAPGTPQHQQCRQVEAQKEIYTRRANKVRRQNAAVAMSAGMQQMSQSYSNAAAQTTYAPRQSYAIPSRQVFCNSQRNGTGISTTCY